MQPWLRVVYILAIGQFIVRLGMTLVRPYLPYFLPELGVSSPEDLAFWAGMISSISFLSQAFILPFWGIAADKYGKRAMILRCTIAICIANLLMALVNNVFQLFALRLVMGFLAGYNASALALIATVAPQEKFGYAVGILQSGQLAGTLLGPVVGGILAEIWSYRAGFGMAGILGFLAFVLIIICIDKPARSMPDKDIKTTMTPLSGYKIMFSNPVLITMLFFIIITQFATQGMETNLVLFVSEVSQDNNPNLTVAALILFTSLAGMIMAPILGRLGDQYGHYRLIIISMTAIAVFTAPMFFTQTITQLFIFRVLAGSLVGGLLPNINAIIGQKTPVERRGAVFGIVSSATSLGNFIGPFTGGIIASVWGIRIIFIITSVILLISSLGCWVVNIIDQKREVLGFNK